MGLILSSPDHAHCPSSLSVTHTHTHTPPSSLSIPTTLQIKHRPTHPTPSPLSKLRAGKEAILPASFPPAILSVCINCMAMKIKQVTWWKIRNQTYGGCLSREHKRLFIIIWQLKSQIKNKRRHDVAFAALQPQRRFIVIQSLRISCWLARAWLCRRDKIPHS